MHGFLTRRGAAAAAAVALVVGGIGAGAAAAQTGSAGTPAPLTGHAGLGLGRTPAAGLPGLGLFKALFAVFGAVRTAVPTIAAPIIAQGVTAGTITAAEGTQLTALLASGKHPTSAGAKPSAGEITVLHSVIAAVLGQLATIAGPVLAGEVTAGDLTQAEADLITKILTHLASLTTPGTGGLATHAATGTLTTSLQSTVTAQVRKHVRAKHKHTRVHR